MSGSITADALVVM